MHTKCKCDYGLDVQENQVLIKREYHHHHHQMSGRAEDNKQI